MYSSYSSSRPSEFSPQSAVTATDGSSWGGTDRRGGWNDQNVSSATHPSNYPSKPHTSTVSTAPELSAAEYTEPGLQTVQSPYPSASPYEPPAYHENYAKRDDHYQHQQQGLIAAGGWKTDGGNGNAYEGGGLVAEKPQKKILGLRRRWLVLLVLVFILVVVGAVVGGVLASRDSKSPDSTGVDAGKQGNTSGNGKGNDGTKPPTPSEDEDLKDKPNLPDPEIIAPESGLTVAGNELDGEVNMRLFFQSKSGRVNYVHYSTSARGWSKPEPLITIQPNSKMLAIDLVYTNGEPADRQINLYYIDPDRGCLQEYCTYIAKKPVVGDLSKNCRTGSVKPESSLSGYWPTIIFQTSTDGMVEYSQNFTRAASVFPWELETMGVDGIKSGSFSALPLHREYNHEGISVMYQKPDGKVAERIRPGPLGTSWTQGQQSDLTDVPAGASLTTLAFAPFGTEGILSQFLLFQTDSPTGELKFYSRTASKNAFDATNWKGPFSSKALKFARKGTQITCLTPSAGKELDTEPGLAKCFFQLEGGQVRMVGVNAKGEWTVDEDILL